MALPLSLKTLREQRHAFCAALEQCPAMSPFAPLLRDVVDGRSRAEKNTDLIRAAAGALPLTHSLRDLTSTVQKRMERAGGWVPDDETIRRVVRTMKLKPKARKP